MRSPRKSPTVALEESSLKTGVPYEAAYELTLRCPLRCSHCYLGPHPSVPELTLHDATAVLKKLQTAGVLFLTLTGGEPTLHPQFFEIVDAAQTMRFALRLYTSGFLTPETAQRVIASGFGKIDVTVMGIDDAHDRIVRQPGAYRRLRECLDAFAASGQRTLIKTTLLKSNSGQIDAIRRLAESYGFEFQIGFFIGGCATGCDPVSDGSEFAPDDSTVERLMRDEIDAGRLSRSESAPDESLLCGAGRFTWTIAPNGDVYPCSIFRLRCGNLVTQSVSDIIASPALRSVRSTTVSDLTDCAQCQKQKFCKRCPGQSLIETGDARSSNSEACRMAMIRERVLKDEK
ncbi:MAG: radical SAM protein [Planctomycetota bacterium]